MEEPKRRRRTNEEKAADLITTLDIETLDRDLFRGQNFPGWKGRVFGGQVLGQALMAASRSIEDTKSAHSFHAYFMRPGDSTRDIIYKVERDFDGRTFSNRRVVASQNGEPILNMALSFQTPEEGFHHQDEMPDVPQPEDLEPDEIAIQRYSDRLPEAVIKMMSATRPIDIRRDRPATAFTDEPSEPVQYMWVRLAGEANDDPVMHRALLAWASDMGLLGTAVQPHGVHWSITPNLQMASLDHGMWFHDDFRMDEWLLYVTDSPWAGSGRGFNRGKIYRRDGRLVAETAQEGLMRLRKPKPENGSTAG